MNRIQYHSVLFLLAVFAFLFSEMAQAVDFKFGGEIRPRFEFADQAVGAKKGQKNTFTTQRTRVNMKAIVSDDVSGFVQIQDVRTFGGATPTTAPPSITQTGTSVSANGLDVHQAYIHLKNILDTGVSMKLGRQEMVFDEHRLIGNINWIQQGQTFDAVRGNIRLADTFDLTAFYARTVAIDTHPTLKDTISNDSTFESGFAGERLTYSLGGKDRITQYFYYALNPSRTGKANAAGTKNTTPNVADNIEYVGAYFLKHFKVLDQGFRVRLDGAYEFGDVNVTTNIKAYMLTAALGTKFPIANGAGLTLWYDYLSGDDNPNDLTVRTFTTPYATNHAYYGHMDKFLNIPRQGLQDIAVKLWLKPTSKMKFIVHLHQFLSARTSDTQGKPPRNLGQEIDAHFKYPVAKNTMLSIGYSRYLGSGTVNGAVTGDSTLDSNWAYAMLDLKF